MKILVWNIKFFSKNRIVAQPSVDKTISPLGNLQRTNNDAQRALQALNYILTTVQLTDPDVFVVLEPGCSAGNPGTLVNKDDAGPAGLIQLLANLRQTTNAWCLVPPQRINITRQHPVETTSQYTECIGVYWRSDRLTFTGPWANTAAGPNTPGKGAAVVYGDPWVSTVPNGTTAAGRCIYTTPNDNQQQVLLGFPDVTSRFPFCTTFTEIGGQQRLLELYSVHCDTKQGAFAADAMLKLPFSQQANKATVIAGDFNINLSYPVGLGATSLSALDGLFGKLFPGPLTKVLGTFDQYPPSMVRPHNKAAPGDYYAKDSAASSAYRNVPETLDFAFLHYDQDPQGVVPSCVVINRISGVPVATAMADPLADFTRTVNPLTLEVFRTRPNYAKIGTPAKLKTSPAVLADGTSDHLPILLTV